MCEDVSRSLCLLWRQQSLAGSARILRLRVSTTECMPPLRLLITAHPFPPGSTLQFPLTSLPSPVYHHSHHRREREKGVDSPIQLRTNPQPYTQTLGPRWRRRYCLRHQFHLHRANWWGSKNMHHHKIYPEVPCQRCPMSPRPRHQLPAEVRETTALWMIFWLRLRKAASRMEGEGHGSIKLFKLEKSNITSLLLVAVGPWTVYYFMEQWPVWGSQQAERAANQGPETGMSHGRYLGLE